MASKPPRSTPKAGGALIALSVLIGAFAGGVQGQPTIGFLIGLGVGLALAAIVLLIDRPRG